MVRKEIKQAAADVIIVGSGVSGLYCALNMPMNRKVIVISKTDPEECDSYLAQGGICMLHDEEDYDSFFEDTMRAGHYENKGESVDIMIRGSQDVIRDLIGYGVDFERTEDGELAFTREGAHSKPRILFHEDITGEEITKNLLAAVRRLPNITLYDHVNMIDIITAEPENYNNGGFNDDGFGAVSHGPRSTYCCGIIATASADSDFADKYGINKGSGPAMTREGDRICALYAPAVVWACGGIGGLFEHSTNFPALTGDALAISIERGIKLENPDYIQIHPTSLYSDKPGRSFLISESVRGEGGILLNERGERFVDELLPRDIVSDAIYEQMRSDGTDHVWLSMENIPQDTILNHFKHIYETCLSEGYDCTKEPIPVVPAQHYFMGGVWVDSESRTSMECLYAVGETSCNGVHGKNRLASNSLLESLVFSKRAARDIAEGFHVPDISSAISADPDVTCYEDSVSLAESRIQLVKNEIERMKNIHEKQHNNEA